MMPATSLLESAHELARAGRHADVVKYLSACERRTLEDTPGLALLYGTAQARLGRHEEGQRWLDVARNQARARHDLATERRALNASGAAALVSGRIDDAASAFTQALMAASRDGDVAMSAACSNNLAIVSNLQGRHAEAIGSWEIALAAFEKVGLERGVAECHHNLGITYREQGALGRALAEADHAVVAAEAAGDQTLWALALRGRAEIRVARGEPELARVELEFVRDLRGRLADPVGEAEDLRVTAWVLAAEGRTGAAEQALRTVIGAAERYGRRQLLAEATRDIALVLRRLGRLADAQGAARTAKAIFTELGAEGEIRALAAQDWDADFGAELRRSLAPLHAAQALADAGQYVTLVTYLSERPRHELEQSPMLALLSAIGYSRLGRLEVGRHWATVALSRARAQADRQLEVRSLNVCGAIALERGGIDEATRFFAQAQDEAMQDNDMATVGRCANNLGIIANLQGRYGRAIGAYTRAIAAYQQVHSDRGVAEAQHNLAITYREQGQLERAMEAAEAAIRAADQVGDPQLKAQALAGRAEIRIALGEADLAVREAERALAMHRELNDAVRETEDLRILGTALSAAGRTAEAECVLRDVIQRATEHARPLLMAAAERDLAQLLARTGDAVGAREAAQTARARFVRLGAATEVAKLEKLLGQCTTRFTGRQARHHGGPGLEPRAP
ncbi:MAG TPA: tetratricopeptide repeat protein [Gemmatimonadales bacterium]|nr:tetratricopeptide repeat protein [Gemmatimonadales bacterium]